MDFDFSWLLWGLPIAFVLGWVASRLDLRQMRIENRQAPKAYFRGLNFLLNEQQDQAIDAFIEAVRNDPDTSELHFALGSLFRRRGEVDRAIRLHQSLAQRPGLTDTQKVQALLALLLVRRGRVERRLAEEDGDLGVVVVVVAVRVGGEGLEHGHAQFARAEDEDLACHRHRFV